MNIIDLNTSEGIEFFERLASEAKSYTDMINMTQVKKYYIICFETFGKKEPTEQELKNVIFACGQMVTLLNGLSATIDLPESDKTVYDRNCIKWLKLYEDLERSASNKLDHIIDSIAPGDLLLDKSLIDDYYEQFANLWPKNKDKDFESKAEFIQRFIYSPKALKPLYPPGKKGCKGDEYTGFRRLAALIVRKVKLKNPGINSLNYSQARWGDPNLPKTGKPLRQEEN